jgi:hypothetical protein
MPQFDLYILENQVVLTLFGFLFFYFFVTIVLIPKLKMYDHILYKVSKFETPKYEFLKLNAFTLGTKKVYERIRSFFV